MELSNLAAKGRLMAAGRAMTGLDQATFAKKCLLSAATISNAENGKSIQQDTEKRIIRTLRRMGVLTSFSRKHGLMQICVHFEDGWV